MRVHDELHAALAEIGRLKLDIQALRLELALRPPNPEPSGRLPQTLRLIAQSVAAKYGTTVDEIRGPRRYRRIVWPRQELYATSLDIGYSSPIIARFCGGRDHSTVLLGAKRHRERMARA